MSIRNMNMHSIHKKYPLVIVLLFLLTGVSAQTYAPGITANITFVEMQRSAYPRIGDVLSRKEDTLRKQFEEKGLKWPAKFIYIRSFKYDSQLEVWVKQTPKEKYKLFKTYKVCALAGTLGPKRMQGDYQVPEGVYHINEFNPKSQYHLSLGLNYPNASDRILSDSLQPGGDIYIHGSCVTTGCIPVTDKQIEDIYLLAMHAKDEGQDFIPVHIFPVHFKNKSSNDYLNRYLKDFPEYTPMVHSLKQVYNYFERTREVPLILINKKGEYLINGQVPELKEDNQVKSTPSRPTKPGYPEDDLAKVVHKLPVFPGGSAAFNEFLKATGNELTQYLEGDLEKAYVLIEYVIDSTGKSVWARVIKGGNDELNIKLEEKFENMPQWQPAIRHEKNVGIKLKQTVVIER
ncbi:MAG TPA: L,D-transpeptidase family protein [Chitinophagaceae bacterium]|nr:L,D-transpeptidase family protein [Chitinophagaceae bacterium]